MVFQDWYLVRLYFRNGMLESVEMVYRPMVYNGILAGDTKDSENVPGSWQK